MLINLEKTIKNVGKPVKSRQNNEKLQKDRKECRKTGQKR